MSGKGLIHNILASLQLVTVGVLLIIAVNLIYLHFTTKVAHGYFIEGIEAERIDICDSVAADVFIYLLSFNITPTEYEHGLFTGGIQPYQSGCKDSVVELSFANDRKQALEDCIIPLWIKGRKVEALTLQECITKDTIRVDFYYDTADLQDYVQKGKAHKHNPSHQEMLPVGGVCMVAVPKGVQEPRFVTLKFAGKELSCRIRQDMNKKFLIKSFWFNDCDNQWGLSRCVHNVRDASGSG